MNKHHPSQGSGLLELMVVILIVAIMAMINMPLLQNQIAAREIDSVARRFITHAHFARQQAIYLGEQVLLAPSTNIGWDGGWLVQALVSERLLSQTVFLSIGFLKGR